MTYVDSADTGEKCEKLLADQKVKAKPIGRAYRNKLLTGSQKGSNRACSRIRVPLEHVFATMRVSMGRAWQRCIGLTRNQAAIVMTNLVYNMVRLEQIERPGLKNTRFESLGSAIEVGADAWKAVALYSLLSKVTPRCHHGSGILTMLFSSLLKNPPVLSGH